MRTGRRTIIDVARMTGAQLEREARSIIDWLYQEDGGWPYGWDWPTFRAVYPAEYARYAKLKSEMRRRDPLVNG